MPGTLSLAHMGTPIIHAMTTAAPASMLSPGGRVFTGGGSGGRVGQCRAALLAVALCLPLMACKDAASSKGQITSGATFLVRVQPADGRAVTPDAVAQARAILEKRLNPAGTRDVLFSRQGADRLFIEVPGISEAEANEAKVIIEKVARLQLRLLHTDSYISAGASVGQLLPTAAEDTEIRPGYVKLRYLAAGDDDKSIATPTAKPNQFLWVKNRAELSGKSVDHAVADVQPGATSYMIHITLESEYGEKMREISTTNLGKPLAICLENTPGEFEVLSAPIIQGVFGAEFQITGKFTEDEARTLASQLMNPLENPLLVEQTSIISPAAPKNP